MPLFRRDPDPEVEEATAATHSVRTQVALLSLQIHREFENLERALSRDLPKNEGEARE